MVEMRVVEQGLGRNAADVQAGATKSATLLDTCDLYLVTVNWHPDLMCKETRTKGEQYLQTLLAGLDCGYITSNTSSDND